MIPLGMLTRRFVDSNFIYPIDDHLEGREGWVESVPVYVHELVYLKL